MPRNGLEVSRQCEERVPSEGTPRQPKGRGNRRARQPHGTATEGRGNRRARQPKGTTPEGHDKPRGTTPEGHDSRRARQPRGMPIDGARQSKSAPIEKQYFDPLYFFGYFEARLLESRPGDSSVNRAFDDSRSTLGIRRSAYALSGCLTA